MSAYYNEHDRFAAAWLRELIGEGLLPPGHVDERDIRDVQSADLAGYDQHHFFAGIGGWALALQLAGWDGPVWTGSCPCQPFSSAGKGQGFEDPRHLWPTWFRLIRECRPPVVFGEQVASADGLAWLDHVSTDLEAEDYAFGAADLCAAGVGAPHIRQRLFFVADAVPAGRSEGRAISGGGSAPGGRSAGPVADPDRERGGEAGVWKARLPHGCGQDGAVADPAGSRPARAEQRGADSRAEGEWLRGDESPRDCPPDWLGNPSGAGLEGGQLQAIRGARDERDDVRRTAPESGSSPWADLLWLPCRDGKARPTQPGLQPLAHGVPNRVGTLRGAGNAIVPHVAAEFIAAYREVTQ